MPTPSGPARRYAFALSLFLPNPGLLPAPPPAIPAVEIQATAPEEVDPLVLPGVVIEEIPKGSALEKAGLQVGDVILSWERLPNPPANPEGARGEINSPFDWLWVEIEQAPRGVVVLQVERDGARRIFSIEMGPTLHAVHARSPTDLTLRKSDIWHRCWLATEGTDPDIAMEQCRPLLLLNSENAPKAKVAAIRLIKVFGQRVISSLTEITSDSVTRGQSLTDAALCEALGLESSRRGEASRASQLHKKALQLRESIAPDSLLLAESLEDLAVAMMAQGQFGMAKRFHNQALGIRQRIAPRSLFEAKSLGNLGALAIESGDYRNAKALLERSLSIQIELQARSAQVTTLHNLASLAVLFGETKVAESHLLEALDLQRAENPESPDEADLAEVIATVYYEMDDFLLTEKYALDALRIYKKNGLQNSEAAAGAVTTLGNLKFLTGDLDESEEFYREALEILRQRDFPGGSYSNVLNNIGLVALARKDDKIAGLFLEEAHALCRKYSPNTRREAAILRSLGVLADRNGHKDQALRYYTQALKIVNKLGNDDSERANILENMAILEAGRGHFAKAERLNREALRIERSLKGEDRSSASILHRLGQIELSQGRNVRAEKFFRDALLVANNGTLDEARTLMLLGQAVSAAGRKHEAVEIWSRSVESLEKQAARLAANPTSNGSLKREGSIYYRNLVAGLLAVGQIEQAFRSVEHYRASYALRELAVRDDLDLALESVVVQPEAVRSRSLLAVEGSPLSPWDRDLNSGKLQLRLEADHIAEVSKALRDQAGLRVGEARVENGAACPNEVGLLIASFFVGETEIDCFVCWQGQLSVQRVRLRAADLLGAVERVRALVESPGDARARQREELFVAQLNLSTVLLEPLETILCDADRLLILPDGPLHYLPFGALVARQCDEPFVVGPLSALLPVYLDTSLSLNRKRVVGRNFPSKASRTSSMVLGDPVPLPVDVDLKAIGDRRVRALVRHKASELQSLAFARMEALAIASLIAGDSSKALVGIEATEEVLLSIGEEVVVLHIAAHAHLDDEFPLNSAIVLSMPEGFPPDRENGLLQVWEIFEKVRLNADLVVLSACETALGEEQGGEGLIGLTRAFQYAGARTVIASLWKVNDQATAELMIRFYKHYLSGLPKDESLRQAQMELIRGPIEVVNLKGEKEMRDFSHPYYWAGFQVYGDWQ